MQVKGDKKSRCLSFREVVLNASEKYSHKKEIKAVN